MRDCVLTDVSLFLQVHRLQGKGHHIVLLGVRLDPNSSRQTFRFETFEDDVLKEAFTEPAAGGNPVPNEFQEALVKTFARSKLVIPRL